MTTKYKTEDVQQAIVQNIKILNEAGVNKARRATIHAMLMPTIFAGDTFNNTGTYFNYAVEALEQAGVLIRHKKDNGREVRFSLV
jgi:hypothetical protein